MWQLGGEYYYARARAEVSQLKRPATSRRVTSRSWSPWN